MGQDSLQNIVDDVLELARGVDSRTGRMLDRKGKEVYLSFNIWARMGAGSSYLTFLENMRDLHDMVRTLRCNPFLSEEQKEKQKSLQKRVWSLYTEYRSQAASSLDKTRVDGPAPPMIKL